VKSGRSVRNSMRLPVIVFLFLLCGTGCVSVGAVPRGERSLVRSMDVGQISGPRLYELSRVWLSRHLYSEKGIFAYENPAEATLVANGVVDYPATGLEAIEKVQYSISFQVKVKTAPGKITLSFQNFMMNVPKVYYHRTGIWFGREYSGGYSRPPLSDVEDAAALRAVSEVSERLLRFLEDQKGVTRENGVQDSGDELRGSVPTVPE